MYCMSVDFLMDIVLITVIFILVSKVTEYKLLTPLQLNFNITQFSGWIIYSNVVLQHGIIIMVICLFLMGCYSQSCFCGKPTAYEHCYQKIGCRVWPTTQWPVFNHVTEVEKIAQPPWLSTFTSRVPFFNIMFYSFSIFVVKVPEINCTVYLSNSYLSLPSPFINMNSPHMPVIGGF